MDKFSLKEELPVYMYTLTSTLQWTPWTSGRESALNYMYHTDLQLLRCFFCNYPPLLQNRCSYLTHTYSDTQPNLLGDYVEATVMLNYNKLHLAIFDVYALVIIRTNRVISKELGRKYKEFENEILGKA